jgi:hypothetical protein
MRVRITLGGFGLVVVLAAGAGCGERSSAVVVRPVAATATNGTPTTGGPPQLDWSKPHGTPAPDSAEYRADPAYWDLVYVRDQIAADGAWFGRVGLMLKDWGPDRDTMTVWVGVSCPWTPDQAQLLTVRYPTTRLRLSTEIASGAVGLVGPGVTAAPPPTAAPCPTR